MHSESQVPNPTGCENEGDGDVVGPEQLLVFDLKAFGFDEFDDVQEEMLVGEDEKEIPHLPQRIQTEDVLEGKDVQFVEEQFLLEFEIADENVHEEHGWSQKSKNGQSAQV